MSFGRYFLSINLNIIGLALELLRDLGNKLLVASSSTRMHKEYSCIYTFF